MELLWQNADSGLHYQPFSPSAIRSRVSEGTQDSCAHGLKLIRVFAI